VRRLWSSIAVVALFAGLAVGTWVLARSATKVEPVRPAVALPATVQAKSGQLEEVRSVRVLAEWAPETAVFGQLAGVVTSIGLKARTSTEVRAGTALYSIDTRPVIILPGVVPAFRDMVTGTNGDDVLQVQQFLAEAGFAPGDLDGEWGATTGRAWQRWMVANGFRGTDVVLKGEVMFLAVLPALMAPADRLVVGKTVSSGEEIASTLGVAPKLALALAKDIVLPVKTRVTVEIGESVVESVVSDRQTEVENTLKVELDVPGGCDRWCRAVPYGATPSASKGTAHLVGPVSGTLIPVGVLRTGSGGQTEVSLADGTTAVVKVLAKVGAEVVVTGIEPGAVIVLPQQSATTVTTS
jgi:hypothetical protein